VIKTVVLGVLIAGFAASVSPAPAVAQSAQTPPADAAARCAAMVGSMATVRGAPTEVTGAKLVEASANLPAFCDVTATIKPNIGVELRLPSATWNGKFFLVGRGGYCRPVDPAVCDGQLRKGYSCIVSDQGQKTPNVQDDVWIYDNTQAQVDCGFRGTHVAAVAGKAMTEKYYGKPPAHSYYIGCSTGGRTGMVEAQKFPYDFDGMAVGAPPYGKSVDGLSLMWSAVAMLDKDGKAVLTEDDVKLLAAAVVAKCDMDDGVKDGIISDPAHCAFDPAELRCKGAKTAKCLSAEQVAAVRKMYDGPHTSTGEKLTEGQMRGSELNWIGRYTRTGNGPAGADISTTNMFRYIADPERGPNWKIQDFNWDKDYKDDSLYEAFMGETNPDLSPFKKAGGKLIIYHGLADQDIMPAATADYYETVMRTMGGRAATIDFARLFLIPGMNHCRDGVGATTFDYISYIEDWVERGKAPDALIGVHLKSDKPKYYGENVPWDPANVAFSRPVYPYPELVRYKGAGDPKDAASYMPVEPAGK
jgi:feruloyl esterase